MTRPHERSYGPWLVALGAGLWGTESAWRIPLNDVFDANVLVFWEHVALVICALPLVLPRLGELRRVRAVTLAWLAFSGVAGSAVGAVLFTLALKYGNPTVVNVVLNVQPMLSTTAAAILFGDRLARGFAPWATLAVIAGMVLVGFAPDEPPAWNWLDFLTWNCCRVVPPGGFNAGVIFALLCALCWGMSTVAGRGVMVEMSLPLASGLRVMVGLVAMAIIVLVEGHANAADLWPAAAAASSTKTIVELILLATLSGGVPLLIYFKGLELTRASTAGYFEMMQTLVAVIITWGFFGSSLVWYQVIGALALIGAVAMVQRVQQQTALPDEPRAVPAAG